MPRVVAIDAGERTEEGTHDSHVHSLAEQPDELAQKEVGSGELGHCEILVKTQTALLD